MGPWDLYGPAAASFSHDKPDNILCPGILLHAHHYFSLPQHSLLFHIYNYLSYYHIHFY